MHQYQLARQQIVSYPYLHSFSSSCCCVHAAAFPVDIKMTCTHTVTQILSYILILSFSKLILKLLMQKLATQTLIYIQMLRRRYFVLKYFVDLDTYSRFLSFNQNIQTLSYDVSTSSISTLISQSTTVTKVIFTVSGDETPLFFFYVNS